MQEASGELLASIEKKNDEITELKAAIAALKSEISRLSKF